MKRLLLLLVCLAIAIPAHADILDEPCAKYTIPKALVQAIIQQESGGNPWCVNVAGKDYHCRSREEALDVIRRNINRSYDVGLMQVNGNLRFQHNKLSLSLYHKII